MITAVIIPAALDRSMRRVKLDLHSDHTDIYKQRVVGGDNLQALELHNPAMTLYSNEMNITPVNIRASLMLWGHNRDLAGRVIIAGQAILTGNAYGVDASVPDDILSLIFEAHGYKVEVDGQGDGLIYEDLPLAYIAGVYHTMPSTPGGEVRISAA